MKLLALLALLFVGLAADGDYRTYGDQIDPQAQALTAEALVENAQYYDRALVRVEGNISKVCQSRGCWMTLDAGLAEDVRILVAKKEDGAYAFTFPKNLDGQRAIVEGAAQMDVLSVEAQQHFAKDAGKSPAEIAAIKDPRLVVYVTATGVLIEE